MRKKIILPLALIFAFLMQPLLVADASATPRAEWTFMIYVCGDNDLHWCWNEFWYPPEYGPVKFIPNLAQFESVGSTNLVNFVALVNLGNYSPQGSQLIHIEKGGYTVLETYPELDMGDPQVCINFVNKVKALYPAKKYLLDFWDHGYGWDYFCYDEGAEDWLNLPELRQIIKHIGYIDIVGFDACNMMQAEVIYELRGCTGYVVASEEYIEWQGWSYKKDAEDLAVNPYWTPRGYATELVANYREQYESLAEQYPWLSDWFKLMTLSAIDMSYMPRLTIAFTSWTSAMLDNVNQYRKQYKKALVKAHCMSDTSYYVDMYDYMVHIELLSLRYTNLKIITKHIETTLKMSVIANWAGELSEGCNGLTFYWAANVMEWAQYRDQYVQEVAWGHDTGWIDFLDAYYP